MPDFMLEPDESDPERPERRRPERLVSAGLAPAAEVPARARKTPETPPAYAPCPGCQAQVLTGTTVAGVLVALDTQVPCYVPLWLPETPRPPLRESGAYPVHRCTAGASPSVASMEG